MKIIKILFLGIVLVLFNIAYLAAQAPADTVFVKTKPVAPGGVLEITYEVHVNSESAGGIIIVVEVCRNRLHLLEMTGIPGAKVMVLC